MAAAILFGTSAFAQVSVTFSVDMTAFTGTLAPALAVAGNFSTNGASAPADWSPADAAGALTQQAGTSIWSVTIDNLTVGDSLQFKFINGNDWSAGNANIEGQAGTTQLTDACGFGDGFGGFNRLMVVPDVSSGLVASWDQCGTLTGFELVSNQTVNFSVFPNPTADVANVEFNVATPSEVSIEVYNALGQRVAVNNLGNVLPGSYKQTLNMETAVAGIYFVKMNVGGKSATSRLSIAK